MSTMNIQGPVEIAAEVAASVIFQLTQRVAQLERQLDGEAQRLTKHVVQEVPDIFKSLQLHGLVLLNTNPGHAADLAERFSDRPAALAALDQAWNLDRAPLEPTVIEQIRVAFGSCNYRR